METCRVPRGARRVAGREDLRFHDLLHGALTEAVRHGSHARRADGAGRRRDEHALDVEQCGQRHRQAVLTNANSCETIAIWR